MLFTLKHLLAGQFSWLALLNQKSILIVGILMFTGRILQADSHILETKNLCCYSIFFFEKQSLTSPLNCIFMLFKLHTFTIHVITACGKEWMKETVSQSGQFFHKQTNVIFESINGYSEKCIRLPMINKLLSVLCIFFLH